MNLKINFKSPKFIKASIITSMMVGGSMSVVGIVLASLGGPGQSIPKMIKTEDKAKLTPEAMAVWDAYDAFLATGIKNTGYTSNASGVSQETKSALEIMGIKLEALFNSGTTDQEKTIAKKEFYDLRSTFRKVVDITIVGGQTQGVDGVKYKFTKVVQDNKDVFITGMTIASIGIAVSAADLGYYIYLKRQGDNPFSK